MTWSSSNGGSGTASGTTSWSISSISLSSGDNTITVVATDNVGNTGKDTITVTVPPQPTPTPTAQPEPCTTDSFEPNEDFDSAYGPLESGKRYEGKLCSSSDRDYFKFELENLNTIQLMLTVPTGNDYDLYLYGPTETEISNSRTTEETETIIHSATTTGMYYVRVYGYGGAYDVDNSYTLAGTWTASNTPTPTPTVVPSPNPTGTTPATGIIIGNVTDATTHKPIAVATVETDDGEYSATTNPAGQFALSNIPAGDYFLTASITGYESSSQSVTVIAGTLTQADFSLTAATVVKPTPTPTITPELCEVYGFVTDEDDKDLSGVTVSIKGSNGTYSTVTDKDGYFEFTGLEAGKYTVTYEKEGYKNQSQDINLEEGEILYLGIIVMKQGISSSIYGTVIDSDNEPIESAKVNLKSKGKTTSVKRKAKTDEQGSFVFTDLEGGTYIIQAKKKGYKKAKERIILSDDVDKEVDLVLEEK